MFIGMMQGLRYILFPLFMFCAIMASAQNMSVSSFKLLDTDLTANTTGTMERDQNGETAALIKVVTTEQGFVFDGGMVGIVKTKQGVGEVWVYVPHGIKKMTIQHPQLGVLRDYYFPIAIEKARTYEMKLTTGKVETVVTHAINKRLEDIEVHFKFDKYNLDLDYMGNTNSLQDFAHKIDSIGISKIDSIVIISQSSPEGVYEHNLMLSRNRANTMRKYILDKHPELHNCLYVHPDGESWARLREHVKKDTLMKRATIEKVISIIDADINVGTKKWRMEQLPVYRYLLKTYYPRIRNSTFYILYYTEIKQIKEPIIEVVEPELIVEAVEVVPDTTIIIETVIPEVEEWSRKLHLKTNAIGLGMAIANVAAEVDLAKHWSFTLPVYYSAWDYFKSTIKFRTFAVQPEFRYWLSEENDGFFGGVHFGLAYYNFAFDGDYRYQDHNRETPAIGGGVSIGYRLPISKNNRWRVEFSLGAGVYSNHCDKFHNTPRTKDGLMIESIKKTYWGIDQAAVSFSYSFDLKKKGGRR